MQEDDLLYVRHILDAARQLDDYVAGHTRADLDKQPMLRDSMIRQLEIIGEAAGRLSETLRGRYSDIPWADIVGMRHRLIHGYFNVNLDLVWEAAVRDVPELRRTLDPVGDP